MKKPPVSSASARFRIRISVPYAMPPKNIIYCTLRCSRARHYYKKANDYENAPLDDDDDDDAHDQ